MSRDNDPANTAMFQAFVDEDLAQQLDPEQDRTRLVKIAAAVAAILVVGGGLLLVLS